MSSRHRSRHRRPRLLAFAVALLVSGAIGLTGSPALAQETGAWNDDIRLGPLVLDPQFRLEASWTRIDANAGDVLSSGPAFSGRRVGVEGRLGQRLSFDVSADLLAAQPWRNVKAEYDVSKRLTITAGRFRVPFGFDGQASTVERRFVYRSRLADAYSMGRDVGGAVEMRLLGKRLELQAGVFASDGDRTSTSPEAANGHRSRVARVTVTPFSKKKRLLRTIEFGVGAAQSSLSQGRSGLRLRSGSGDAINELIYWAKGRRQRTGFDLRWHPGRLTLAAEYARASDERREQGVLDETLPPLTGTAWYTEGAWSLSGERSPRTPRHAITAGGAGAFELVGRLESAALGTPGLSPALASSPRAPRPGRTSLGAATVGLNWYPFAGVRLQMNLVHETFAGATSRTPGGGSRAYTGVVQLQVTR